MTLLTQKENRYHGVKGDTMMIDTQTSELFDQLSSANQALIKQLVARLATTESLSPKAQKLNYFEYVLPWLANLRREGRSPLTLSVYRARVLSFLRSYPQPTKAIIQGHLTAKAALGVGASSLNNELAAISSFFNYLLDIGLVDENPTSRIKRTPRPYRERKIPDIRDVSELLSQEVRLKDRVALLLMLDCGLRVAELVTLRVSDVSFVEGALTVIGKGDKQRTVPMGKSTQLDLKHYLQERDNQSPYVFAGRNGVGHENRKTVNWMLNSLCQRIGIKRLSPHQLRHFYATAMVKDGASLPVVSQLLGHRDIRTTMIYVHIDEEMKRQQHAKHSPLKRIAEVE